MKTNPVFDNPVAFKLARKATDEAIADLNRTPRHLLDPSNPNHPQYDVVPVAGGARAFNDPKR